MKTTEMKADELELLALIRNSKNPERMAQFVVDCLMRTLAGEEVHSIAASYGINLQEAQS